VVDSFYWIASKALDLALDEFSALISDPAKLASTEQFIVWTHMVSVNRPCPECQIFHNQLDYSCGEISATFSISHVSSRVLYA
jgi:hypothetical protein